MDKFFYVTTPVYYVNDLPHIGHAYTSIAADVLARFKRMDGFKVKFLTGTDEHGQKVEKSSINKGMKPKDFVNKTSRNFENLSGALLLTNDDFVRTTQQRHKKAAIFLFNKLLENEQIYKGSYIGWYCLRDEAFYNEDEIVDGLAPTGAPVEWVEESNLFFKLSEYQDRLLKFYDENPSFVTPTSRFNEVKKFVQGGLKDLSISRSTFDWGIKIPNTKDVMYVWIDALTNYLTGLDCPNESENMTCYWENSLHLVGKDILRFHAVYWPAFLMGAKLQPPKQVFAHGWWTNEGEKMSKSLGNAIDPFALCNEFGVDEVRYFMMREISFGKDGNFSRESLINRINQDLANSYGNLVQRISLFVIKHCESHLDAPEQTDLDKEDVALLKKAIETIDSLRTSVADVALHRVAEQVFLFIGAINRYVDAAEPWALRKTDVTQMKKKLYVASIAVVLASLMAIPIMPKVANKALDIFNFPVDKRNFKIFALISDFIQGKYDLWSIDVSKPQILFSKVVV